MSNRISVIIDATTTGAISSLKNFRTAVADAEGFTGKAKAGITSAFDGIKSNIAGFALAAGAAVAAWGLKAATEFQNTALEAGRFADAVGISMEDASRWLEVAGDFGVESGAIESAMLKFNAALGAGRIDLEEWGGKLAYAKDGTIDANTSFQNAVTTIGAIEDPTKRAQAAQTAFGKNYKQIAELMELDAKDLEAALDGVSDSKIIDEDEVRKARDARAAMDELKDKLEDVTLAVGEVVAEFIPMVTTVADVTLKVIDLKNAAEDLTGSGGEDGGFIGNIGSQVKWFVTNIKESRTPREAFTNWLKLDAVTAAVAAKVATEDTGTAIEDLGDSAVIGVGHLAELETGAVDYKLAAREAEQATKDFDAAVKTMLGEVNAEQAWLDIKAKVDGFAADMAAAKGDTDAERLAVLDLKESMIEYVGTLETVPAEKKTQILALIDEENFRLVEVELAKLEKSRYPVYTPVFNPPSGGGQAHGATGGIVTRPTMALIGEAGPEAVIPLNRTPGSSPLPGGLGVGTGASSSQLVNVTINTGADPQQVITAVKQYLKRGGTL